MTTMTYTPNVERKERILYLLKNYYDMDKRRRSLQRQIAEYVDVSYDDVIEMLAFMQKLGDKVQSGEVSNPTQDIALKYREVADKLNEEALAETLAQHKSVDSELNMLRFYVDLLDRELSDFITDMCIESQPRSELREKYGISNAALYKRLYKAVSEIDWLLSARM